MVLHLIEAGMILNKASIQFGTRAMTFQSINKINSSTPPNRPAHSASNSHSDTTLAVAFRYTGSKPSLAILLINAVLSSQGKCACIPLVRSVFRSPTPILPATPQAKREYGGSRGLFPAAVPLFPAPDWGPRCAHGQQQQFEQCKSPVRPRHLQIQPHYLARWRNYRSNKSTSGKNSFNLSNQTCLDWGTIQRWYCTLSISSAHRTKATWHLALTHLAIR